MKIIKFILEVLIKVDITHHAQSITPTMHTAHCSECGWRKDYHTPEQAKRGLAAHYHHCPGPGEYNEVSKLWDMMNGRKR